MKILITGRNSFIGNAFYSWVQQQNPAFNLELISLREESEYASKFHGVDSVFHVSGIAHVPSRSKETKEYYDINRDKTIEVARIAKNNGVRQFIFMSSIIVYGDVQGMITMDTLPSPSNSYSDSKLQAERALEELVDNNFKVAIIRSPMVYGKGAKGNYQKLSKLARTLPVFPDLVNKRSMIYINNLCELVRLIIVNNDSGTFYPQNEHYVCTSDLVREIAMFHHSPLATLRAFNFLIRMGGKMNLIRKMFGDLYYAKELSMYPNGEYRIYSFEESIAETESLNKMESSKRRL